MIAILSLGRVLMVAWIAYALVLLFEPALLHHAPDATSASAQALVAFGLGYIMDRVLSVLRKRKAEREERALTSSAGANIHTDGPI